MVVEAQPPAPTFIFSSVAPVLPGNMKEEIHAAPNLHDRTPPPILLRGHGVLTRVGQMQPDCDPPGRSRGSVPGQAGPPRGSRNLGGLVTRLR